MDSTQKSPGAEESANVQENVAQVKGIVTGTDQLTPGGVPRKANKVAIVGFAPSSMRDVMALFKDPTYEIWGLNQLYIPFPELVGKASRWFQIHHRHSYDQTVIRDHSHHAWLGAQRDFPIYMQQRWPDIPLSVVFPKDELVEHFGNYFTNSISWMIALAIWEEFEEVHIYGVDMATDSEYAYERPSVEFFLGWFKGKGDQGPNQPPKTRLILPEKCDLLKSMWLYPFDDSAPFRAKLEQRRGELRERSAQLGHQTQASRDQHMQMLGALENMNYIEKSWVLCQREIVTPKTRMTKCPYCNENHDYRVTACPVPFKEE